MDADGPFRPLAGTTIITAAVAGSAPSPVQLGGPVTGEVSLLCLNDGAATAFLVYGSTSAICAANAAAGIPTTGNPQNMIAMHQNQPYTLNMPAGMWYSAIIASGTAPVYITPGNGKL